MQLSPKADRLDTLWHLETTMLSDIKLKRFLDAAGNRLFSCAIFADETDLPIQACNDLSNKSSQGFASSVVLLRHYIVVTASLIIRHCERVNGMPAA